MIPKVIQLPFIVHQFVGTPCTDQRDSSFISYLVSPRMKDIILPTENNHHLSFIYLTSQELADSVEQT